MPDLKFLFVVPVLPLFDMSSSRTRGFGQLRRVCIPVQSPQHQKQNPLAGVFVLVAAQVLPGVRAARRPLRAPRLRCGGAPAA